MHVEHRPADAGSALLLVPAAFLVVLVLGAISVDLSVRFLAQREAVIAAEAAANDAASAGLTPASLDGQRPIVLDAARVERIALRSLAAHELADRLVEPPRVELVGDDTVRIRLRVSVTTVFSPVLPGVDSTPVVTASAAAQVQWR